MDSSNFKVVCDHCDAKLANVFCHSDGAFLCPQCDAQVHSVNKLAQRHLRVPCQSCPVWAYREAKSRGRLLDMPLAACLTRNLQMDIFDGSTTCWPSNNASSVALGTPQSDVSSPQAAAAPANAGSPGSEVHAAALHQASNSWPQNSALALVASQPQPVPQASLGCNSISQGVDQADAFRATQFALSPFSNCSGSLQAAAAAPQNPQAGAERCSAQGVQASTPAVAAAALSQAAQSQHSQHTLQRAASQEVMDAVDSMDVALLLDTFGAPLDQLQDKRKAETAAQHEHVQAQQPMFTLPQQQPLAANAEQHQMQLGALNSLSVPGVATGAAAVVTMANGISVSVSPGWAPLAQQVQVQQQQALLQQQQQQAQLQQQQLFQEQMEQRQAQVNAAAAAAAGCLVQPGAFAVSASEPMAVPVQRQQPAVRSLSGLSCLSQSALSSSNTDGPQLGSARSSNTMLLQSFEQQMGGTACAVPMALAGVAAANGAAGALGAWPSVEATQRQLQQLQQQQHQAALQYLQQKQQQQQQVAAALAAAQQKQQQQQQAMQQLLQRSMTDDLPRTSPISIGNGTPAAVAAFAAAAARRDAALRSGLGLGLSDPGIGLGRGRSLAQSPISIQQPGTAFASGTFLLDNLSGIAGDPSSIAAAANATAAAANPLAAAAAAGLLPGATAAPPTAAGAAVVMAQPLPSTRSLDAATSSFGALPMAIAGSGGSTSVSPSNCNTLAGAVAERQSLTLTAQQMVLPGSAPPALGLAASVSMVSRGGSCDLSETQLMRMSSDGHDAVLGAAATASFLGGSMGMLGLGCDGDAAGLLMRVERPDGSFKDLDPDRAAQLNRYKQKRMLRMRALAEGAKKIRYECRKQLADTRPRVRGRFAKVKSSEALAEFGSAPMGGGGMACSVPATSSGNNGGTASVVTGSVCTAPPGMVLHQASGSGWGLHSHHGLSQPHMQRIDEEGTSEGQSPFVLLQPRKESTLGPEAGTVTAGGPGVLGANAGAAAEDGVTTNGAPHDGREPLISLGTLSSFDAFQSDTLKAQQQQQQQKYLQDGGQHLLRRHSQSSSMLDAGRTVGSAPAGLLGSCNNAATPEVAVEPSGLVGPTQDCVITEQDLATLGFDDLPQLSGGFSNAGNSNEDMDESAESMNDGSSRPASGSGAGARPPQPPSGQPSASVPLAAPPQQQFQALRSQSLMAPQPASPQALASLCSTLSQTQFQQQQQQQMQLTMQMQQPRLSVLDRPIMYGTDRSQFSAAQLSLLDSILTDQYRPSGPGGRH